MRIHLGWTGSAVPPHVMAAAEAARAVATGCEVTLHTDDSMIPAAWRERMDAMRLAPHMRSDVQRHCILREYGGLWLDADVRLLVTPAEWASAWDRYTAIRLMDGASLIGIDILYVPCGWPGWDAVDSYIDGFLSRPPAKIPFLGLGSDMIRTLSAAEPEHYSILDPGQTWPYRADRLTTASVVARGFDPSTVTPRAARRGLGDLVASGLSAIGITPERVSAVTGRPCGCKERARKLNELGRKLGIG